METKLIEVRDEGTMMIVLGIKFRNVSAWEANALARAGYGETPANRDWYVILIPMDGGANEAHNDPYSWGGHGRTMLNAHRWLRDTEGAWDSLPASGALLDVEYILGETSTPKTSEVR